MLDCPGGPVRGQDENAGRARSEAHTRVAAGLTLPAAGSPLREGREHGVQPCPSFPGRGSLFLSGPWGRTGHLQPWSSVCPGFLSPDWINRHLGLEHQGRGSQRVASHWLHQPVYCSSSPGRGPRDPPELLFGGRGSGPGKGRVGMSGPRRLWISAKLTAAAGPGSTSCRVMIGVGRWGGDRWRECSRGRPPPSQKPPAGASTRASVSAPRAAVRPLLPLPLEPLGKDLFSQDLAGGPPVCRGARQGAHTEESLLGTRGPEARWMGRVLLVPHLLKVVLRLGLEGKADI